MSPFAQSPFFVSLTPIPIKPTKKSFFTVKHFNISASLNPTSSPNFQENPPESKPPKPETEDSIKLALAKAKTYKDPINSKTTGPNIVEDSLAEGEDGVNKEVPLAVKLALEKAREYKKSKGVVGSEGTSSENVKKKPVGESDNIDQKTGGLKSDEFKDVGGDKDVPSAVKLALEKAKEYKKNKGVLGSITEGMGGYDDTGLKGGNVQCPGDSRLMKNPSKKGELSISSVDFMGLGFADKKSGRGLPAGLVPISDSFSEGDFPEVEILVGDKSKFDEAAAEAKPESYIEDDVDVYKPKVSTWEVFPRPRDISKTYGGGRTIRPGEALESKEARAAKEARTRQLLAAYKSKTGLNIDPELRAVCEKALKDGDSLMDLGKLKEALPFYAEVMEKLPFKSKIHGLAALQWSICQDSLSRSDEARMMYEKLQSHPSPDVSKKASQLAFSFQAVEMMKVSNLNVFPLSSGYQNYFDAFVKDKKNYPLQEGEVDEGSSSTQTLPYIIFLLSPVLIVSLIAAFRH